MVAAGAGLFEFPAWGVFELVVVTAERCEVFGFGWPALSPGVGVVEV